MDNDRNYDTITNNDDYKPTWPNDISGYGDIDDNKKDDGPEPNSLELYKEKDYDNKRDDGPGTPPPSSGVIQYSEEEWKEIQEGIKQKPQEEVLPPYVYDEGNNIQAQREMLEGLRQELVGSQEQEKEYASMTR